MPMKQCIVLETIRLLNGGLYDKLSLLLGRFLNLVTRLKVLHQKDGLLGMKD